MRCALLVAIFAILTLSAPNRAVVVDERTPAPLRPGLVVTYQDGGTAPAEITGIEPTIALALKAGEAPHPRLAPDDFRMRWEGQLKILRPAEYTLAAQVLGRFRLLLDGKEVLPAAKSQATLRLEAGNHPLVAEFTRQPGQARVRLFWQAKHIFPEPVPFDALGHLPAQEPERLADDQLIEQGRFLAEEHSCSACHRPGDDDGVALRLENRQGPDLSRVGERVRAEWFAAWLQDPKHLQVDAVMPRLFPDGPGGEAELYAVASYLASLGGRLKPDPEGGDPKERRASRDRGERLFTTAGCGVCHESANGSNPLLRYLQGKSTIGQIARFLQDPLATHPAGRMPSLLLNAQEAADLARFLSPESVLLAAQCKPPRQHANQAFARIDPRAEERSAFEKLPEDPAWMNLGERLVLEKRCNACHKIEPNGKPLARLSARADFDAIRKPAALAHGCLAEDQATEASPWFAFTPEQRRALRAFLKHGASGPSTPAPSYAARVAMQRFACLKCHQMDGQGGLSTDLIDQLRQFEKAEYAEAVSPPPLTDIGAKLTTAWSRKVLVEAARARPWMGLRMPQFGAANVGHLPAAFAACAGIDDALPTTANSAAFGPAYAEADVNAGRLLVGKKGLGCIACHDIAGVPSSGTRGPDLAAMNQRVRYDWYRRWLIQPQKMQPGTRMPTVFNEGRTLLDEVLRGDAAKQADAMWSYLALGPTLPLPEGLEPPKGLVLTVQDRPVVLRTFMPDAGTRAIAVGCPGEVSVAYDAGQCRLAYAWSGNFLDASPVWNDRGGFPAKILGTRFWEAPRGFPWFFEKQGSVPDVAARAHDPAFGAPPPEGKVYAGTMRLHSEGYQLRGGEGQPVFICRTDLPEGGAVRITEQVRPLRSSAGVGLRRTFTLSPSPCAAWLLLGESFKLPRLFDAQGQVINAGQTGGEVDARSAVLSSRGGRLGVSVVEAVPSGTRVQSLLQKGSWRVLLRIPPAAESRPMTLSVSHWQPYRNEERFVTELVGAR